MKEKLPLRDQQCLTIDEASEILRPLLNDYGLIYFLQEHGFVDEAGVPYKEEFTKEIFKFVGYGNKNAEYDSLPDPFYITSIGLRRLFNIAFGKYILEKPTVIVA